MIVSTVSWEAEYEPPRRFAAPLVHDSKNWKPHISRLDRMCPLVEEQTQANINGILNLYPKHALVVAEWKSYNQIISQCLLILKKLRQTMVCFDYKWVKEMVTIDLSKANIDAERNVFTISGDSNFDKYFRFIWSWYDWDIHLPNGILRAKVETKWQWEFIFSFPHVPYEYRETCSKAKRSSLRAELKTVAEARSFFKWLNTKGLWVVEYCITNSKWEILWIVKDMSNGWLWIYVHNSTITSYKEWIKFSCNLSLPDLSMKVPLVIVSITKVEWENFSLVWTKFVFSNKTKDQVTIDDVLFRLNSKICDEIRELKEDNDFK